MIAEDSALHRSLAQVRRFVAETTGEAPTDEELAQLHTQMQDLPAGGVLAVLGIVLIVLIVLELTGAIDIFKKA